MVAEVVTQLIAAVAVDQHIGRNAVDPEFLAKVFPLRVVEPVMLARDLGDAGLVGDQRRGLVGDVYPHQVVALQFTIESFSKAIDFNTQTSSSRYVLPFLSQLRNVFLEMVMPISVSHW